MTKKGFLTLFRILLVLLPFIWIFHRIDMSKLYVSLKAVATWTIPVLGGIVLLLMFLQGIRWWVLLRAFLPQLPLSEVLSCHFKGIYYSIFLPTSAAQDIVRTVLLSRHCDYGVAWGATWVTRILGLSVLLLTSVYGAMNIDPDAVPQGMKFTILISITIIVFTVLLSFSKGITRIFRKIFVKILPVKIIVTIERIREGIYRFRSKWFTLLIVALITVVVQLLVVCSYVFLIKGITGSYYIVECLTYIPLIEIICLSVPLTPNGIGVRDALSALMFHQIGLPVEQLGIYIILSLGSTVLKVVGGLPLLYEAVLSFNKRSG